ncbi:hypothetical protein [Pseudonocardia sp. D17]|uniref:hypothetical protein n=1 Tax=Pseudonocardia sp. D17 TaxID=882661 RepID=UPI002B3A2A21|nr:hypothetical protein PSD17_39360 [Pseudonocardia sp. D17]
MPSHRATPRRWFKRRPQPETPAPAPVEADDTDPTPTRAASPVIRTVPVDPPAPLDADSAPTSVIPRIPAADAVVEPAPSAPSRVTLHYPDGHTHALDCMYDGPSAFDATRHRWIAVVPDEARLVNGMVVRVDRKTVLAVALRDKAAG